MAALQKIVAGQEVRREGAKATREPNEASNKFESRPGSRGQDGPGVDGGVEGKRVRPAGPTAGYIGSVGELERNDDTRHPTTKIWVRRDRKPDAYLHTGNG